MSSSHLPDDPKENPFKENPFEAYGGSASEDYQTTSADSKEWQDLQSRMPPVENSYWIGVIVLGLMSLSTCILPGLFYSAPMTGFTGLGMVFLLFSWFCGLLFLLLPLSLIRLGIHCRSIAQAIERQSYPGGQKFDFGYLVYSLVLSFLCMIGGCTLFFGICSGFFFLTEGVGLFGQSEWLLFPLLTLDGIVSLMATFFLLNQGIPKYR